MSTVHQARGLKPIFNTLPQVCRRVLLACGWVGVAGWSAQAQAGITCDRPTLSLYSDGTVAALSGDQTFKYPMEDAFTVFSGFAEYIISGCTGVPMTFTSRIINGNVTNNTGLTVTPTGIDLLSCDSNSSTATTVTATALGANSKWGCSMRFKFNIKTNANVLSNAYSGATIINPGSKLVATALDGVVVYSTDATFGSRTVVPVSQSFSFFITFDPKSCRLANTISNVDLGAHTLASVTNPSETDWKTFNLVFSGCGAPGAAYTIQTTFSYTAFDVNNPLLIANSGGNASYIGVELAYSGGPIASGTAYTLATTSSGVNSYTVPLKARIRAVSGNTPKAGSLSATATFTVSYQ